MTGPAGDVTANYLEIMRERGMTWGDLADQFDRDAVDGKALDGGANARRMAVWARSQEEAGRERREAADDPSRPDPGAPDHATPTPPARTVTPRTAPAKRATGATASGAGD